MVLPGIQALFGFQLIAVFSPRFSEVLTLGEQRLHLAAIALVALAVGLIMTPAAYHRRMPREVTDGFVRLSTRLLLSSMLPLALSIAVDVYLIARVTLDDERAALTVGGVLFITYCALWFVLPSLRRSKP
jgi:hypothetical protein